MYVNCVVNNNESTSSQHENAWEACKVLMRIKAKIKLVPGKKTGTPQIVAVEFEHRVSQRFTVRIISKKSRFRTTNQPGYK